MFVNLVILYFVYVLCKLILSLLQIKFVSQKSKEVAVILNEIDYKNAASIAIANQKFEIFSLFYHFVIFMCWLLFGFEILTQQAPDFGTFNDVFFVISFLVISSILDLPLNVYESFVKDKKHGFSNMTAKIFIIDTLKALVLMIVFGSAFIWLILWCLQTLGQLWWFWAFCVSFLIILVINLIYPTIIAPLFNKLKPLEDGELKSAIEGLLNSLGFKSSGVFSMDASKRDNRLNAYFGGFGATKRVVLFDTLIAKLSVDEIIAVLGHELGHFKHGDIFKMIAMSAMMTFALFAIFGNIPNFVYESIGLSANGAGVIVFMLLFSPIFSFIFSPIISYVSRKNEFGADKFGAGVKSKDDMINALKKLGSENKSFPMSHPLFAFVYYSHPSLYERINELK
ncbi:MAG: M48 family metallopeptidase [Campylobacter sp.]